MASIPRNLGDLRALKKREKKAHDNAARWRDLYDDVYEYCLPNRNLFNEETPGQKKMDKIFDSTALESIQIGASKLQENIAPAWKKWAKIEPSSQVKRMKEYEQFESQIKESLDKQTDIIFDYINNSNFHTQFYEAGLDLLIGTATIRIDENLDSNDSPIIFKTIPQFNVSFEEGPLGTIETHWRRLKLKARNVEREYQGFEASEAVKQIILKSPESEIELREGVVYDPKDKVYHGIVWVSGEDRISWHEEYSDSSPWVTARYTKVAGEDRGRGPAVQVLPDIKTLNKVEEFSLKKCAIDLSGIYTVQDDGVINPYSITIAPGVAIPVSSNNSQNPTLARLDTNQRLDLTLFEIERMQNNIRRAFFNDLRDPDAPVRSATEIAIEARDLAKRIGSAFGRMQTELLVPILNRVAWILARRGLMDKVKINGEELTIKFTSPLALAQDSEDLLSLQQAVEFTLNTAGPEAVKMSFKQEDFGTYAAEKTGVAQRLVRSNQEKQQVIQAGAQVAQQEMANNGMGRTQPQQ